MQPIVNRGDAPDDLAAALAARDLTEVYAALDSRNRFAFLNRIQTAVRPETRTRRIEQLTDAARAIGSVLAGGVQTIAEVTRLDPELASTALETSTCQQLRAERTG